MTAKAVLIKLKPDSLDRVREWAKAINKRKDEALATLRDEAVVAESWFLLSLDDGDYLLAYMRAKDMKKAHEAVKDSLHEIDALHQQFKQDAWVKGGGISTELLVDLSLENSS